MKPSAPILLTGETPSGKPLDVLRAPDLFAVFYRDEPVTLREHGKATARKYLRSTFPNPTHARRLASRLNEQFGSSDFTVRRLVMGESV